MRSTLPPELRRRAAARRARCQRCGALPDLVQVCVPCGEELCGDCYGPWTALACDRCRDSHTHLVVR